MGIQYAACDDCGVDYPDDREKCPHCGRPSKFPNVVAARRDAEKKALDRRYDAALKKARASGSEGRLLEFQAGCEKSPVVLCCPTGKLILMAQGSADQFAGFYDLLHLRFSSRSVAKKVDWNVYRPNSENALLGSDRNKDKLHYAALSWNGEGLSHYGGKDDYCEVELRVEMIAHRASLFEENLGVFYWKRDRNSLPTGKRGDWEDRGKLCVAKLGAKVSGTTSDSEFPEILLKSKPDPLDDEFVEVHVYGEMTLHTFRRVRVVLAKTSRKGASPQLSGRVRTKRDSSKYAVLREKCERTFTGGEPVDYAES
jgi:hypothetical protein